MVWVFFKLTQGFNKSTDGVAKQMEKCSWIWKI